MFIKKLISPIQSVMLKKALCPGCAMPLDRSIKRFPFRSSNVLEIVYCKCGRAFVYDKSQDFYRRALQSELSSI